MRLLELNVRARPDGARITGTVERAGSRFEVYFDYRLPGATLLDACPDAFAAALLLPCMRAHESLEVIPPISPLLRFNLPRIRDIFCTWWPHLARIEILTTPRATSSEPRNFSATFFSGGVDSFYSLLKHRSGAGTLPQRLTHLLFMRGVEIRLQHGEGIEDSESWVQRIAEATGVHAVFGETNLRTENIQGAEDNLNWERNYHGSALAAIGLGLSHHLAYVCIPSAFSYNHMVSHGSTPLVDEMYSTESVRVLHDGSEVTRAEKVARILEWDRELVLTHLRVCIHNLGGAFNCGRCYKCVRTAVALRALGVWDQVRTFRDKTTDHWEETLSHDHLALTEENLQLAQKHGADAPLISMLRSVVRRRRRSDGVTAYVRNSPLDMLRPFARRVRSFLQRK